MQRLGKGLKERYSGSVEGIQVPEKWPAVPLRTDHAAQVVSQVAKLSQVAVFDSSNRIGYEAIKIIAPMRKTVHSLPFRQVSWARKPIASTAGKPKKKSGPADWSASTGMRPRAGGKKFSSVSRIRRLCMSGCLR